MTKQTNNSEIKLLFTAAKAIKEYCQNQIDTVLNEGDNACENCVFLKKHRCVFSCSASEWDV